MGLTGQAREHLGAMQLLISIILITPALLPLMEAAVLAEMGAAGREVKH